MTMTLLAKVLWFIWTFVFAEKIFNFIEELPEKIGFVLWIIISFTVIITTVVVAILPFINLLWK